jgi:hypothetical protein
MAVEPGYGQWLKSPARFVGATISGAAATWGDTAVDSRVISPLAVKADAQAEAVREAQFLAGPIVRDAIVVEGLWSILLGYTVTIRGDRAGYEQGATVFVIGADENKGARYTTLSVLKRL